MHSWTMKICEPGYHVADRWVPRLNFSSKSESEFIKTRLTVNDVLAVTDHPLDSIIHVSRGDGYTQYGGFPVPVRSTWPISLEEYRRRQRHPWPTRDDYELDTVVPQTGPDEIDRERQAEIDQELQQTQAVLDAKIMELFAGLSDDDEQS